MRTIKNLWLAMVIFTFAAIFFAGCAKHYEVTDTQTGKVYYTQDVDYKKGGAVGFRDAKTDNKIVLQSSEVRKIKKKEFNVRVYSEN